MKRNRFAEEQIIRILHEAERGELSIQDICRKHEVIRLVPSTESLRVALRVHVHRGKCIYSRRRPI